MQHARHCARHVQPAHIAHDAAHEARAPAAAHAAELAPAPAADDEARARSEPVRTREYVIAPIAYVLIVFGYHSTARSSGSVPATVALARSPASVRAFLFSAIASANSTGHIKAPHARAHAGETV